MRILILLLLTAVGYAATPAEMAIEKAQAQSAKKPDYVPYYNTLAMAYARRARETSDVQYYAKAEETLKRSFALAPDNYEGLKTEAWLQLGRHEFAKALETANKLNKKTPDDVTVYGYLADANTELGNYPEAIAATQWMLDLRPGNVAGLTRAGYQRELHGNLSGAIELMHMAYGSTPYGETEDRAWLLTQIAHLNFVNGDLSKAEQSATSALNLFPNYHYALGALAQVRIEQKRFDDAVTLLRQRYGTAPHAENLYALAEALELAGKTEESKKAFAEFESKSLAETNLADNSNHELIAYYVDHAHQPQKALEIAKRELARRKDVFTLDGYAWALAANGEYESANIEIHAALAGGVKDPRILYHAARITELLSKSDKGQAAWQNRARTQSQGDVAVPRPGGD
jgi:tetratricopeptide (TPR) repeat protein